MNVSVVILTKNEACNIQRCLEALTTFDDVVVVDSGSTDATRRIAAGLGARILCHPFESFAQQRNWALEHGDLRHPWALMLDADEVVTPEFCHQLDRNLRLATNETAGFMICRKTIFLGRWLRHSDAFPVWITRVVRRGQATFVDAGHGEKAVAMEGQAFVRIDQPILHYSFSKGISDWVDRHNRYSSQEARTELHAAGVARRGGGNCSRPIRSAAARRCSRYAANFPAGRSGDFCISTSGSGASWKAAPACPIAC